MRKQQIWDQNVLDDMQLYPSYTHVASTLHRKLCYCTYDCAYMITLHLIVLTMMEVFMSTITNLYLQ